MDWTDEKVEQLQKFWSEGLSASKIAAILGNVSRNAVIGKVYRLKLSNQQRNKPENNDAASTIKEKKAQAQAQVKEKKEEAPPKESVNKKSTLNASVQEKEEPVEKIEKKYFKKEESVLSEKNSIHVSRNIHLVDLTQQTCKWPNGDPLQKDFSFCGNNITESGPYCAYHAKIAFQNFSDRRKNS